MDMYISGAQLAHNIYLSLVNKIDKTKEEILLMNQCCRTMQTYFRMIEVGVKDLIQKLEDTQDANSGATPQ